MTAPSSATAGSATASRSSATIAANGAELRRLRLPAGWPAVPAPDVEPLIRRGAVPDPAIRAQAAATIAAVRADGAEAVREANGRVGGGRLDGRLVIDRPALAAAADALTPANSAALDAAIAAVRRFAEVQRPVSREVETVPGVRVERRWEPLDSVGAYVPGGTAPYPSTLVMTVVPARVAGVRRIVVATPADPMGEVHPVVLGAAGRLGVDAVLVAGGAQAVAALAIGLPEIGLAPVDRIVGPGNPWVTAAKLELAGDVGIDLPAGPSEGMVLAEPPADPVLAAADLLTQAEHGVDSPAILVTTDEAFADRVEAALASQLAGAARRDILATALEGHGAIVVAPDRSTAIAFVNAYAPEHLSIDVPDPEAAAAEIRNAGSVFVGPWAPESAGDYATGANHVLPTGGLARACGALSVETFGHFIQVQRIRREGLLALRPTIRALAEAEGLLAHRDAVERRFEARS